MPLGDASRSAILLLLKAFAGGSVALTGVEAIANGVPAFKPPEAKNAANTLTAMAILLGVLFVGITVRGRRLRHRARPRRAAPSVVALAARTVVRRRLACCSSRSPARTALILFLAANTCFNAFPRLAAILAEDGYMPRQFSFRGDRLAYSWGIVLLAAIAFGLLVAFGGDTHAADPALLGRRLRVLHPQPDRDGPALAARRARRAGGGGWRSTRFGASSRRSSSWSSCPRSSPTARTSSSSSSRSSSR